MSIKDYKYQLQYGMLFFVAFGLVCLSLLSPLASNSYLPSPEDFITHTSSIYQAKLALQQGIFPLRAALLEHNSWSYPQYQFYSNLPYMIAGFFQIIFLIGPFMALKLTLWCGLMFAALYTYKISFWLSKNRYIAIITAICYIFSPYLLIDMNVRGGFTSACAQCLVPALLFYTLKIFFCSQSKKIYQIIMVAIFYSAIMLSHVLTFIYLSIFLGLLVLYLVLIDKKNIKAFLMFLVAYAWGLILSAWYLIPIVNVVKYLFIHDQFSNPYMANWFTPILVLLSPKAISPIPIDRNILSVPLFMSIGWPVLVASFCAILLILKPRTTMEEIIRILVVPALALLILAIFMTWSPINFWKHLPNFFLSLQVPARLLTQIMWIGIILITAGLMWVFDNKINKITAALMILIIVSLNSSWLMNDNRGISLSEFMKKPLIGNDDVDYLVDRTKIDEKYLVAKSDLPLVSNDGWLYFQHKLNLPSKILTTNTVIVLQGQMNKKAIPNSLSLYINGKQINKKSVNTKDFTWIVPLGIYAQKKNQSTLKVEFHAKRYIQEKDRSVVKKRSGPKAQELFNTTVKVNKLVLENLNKYDISVNEAKDYCHFVRENARCSLAIRHDDTLLQLPLLYYPGLLSVIANGKNIKYFPTSYREYLLAGVRLNKGNYDLNLKFGGNAWSNYLSLFWIFLSILILVILIYLRVSQFVRDLAVGDSTRSGGLSTDNL